MATQCISAAQALSLAGGDQNPYQAVLALCGRAHRELIKTRADRLVVGSDTRDDVIIPHQFWWAGGHEALDQDWTIGDFSTWIKQQVHWQAFGVRFDLDGVLAMVPADQHAAIRRKLSVSGDPAWVSARDARKMAYSAGGVPPPIAGDAIVEQCRLGFVDGRAVLMQRSESGRSSHVAVEEREWTIPGWFWTEFTLNEKSHQDWARGVFSGAGKSPYGHCYMTLRGVHFSRASVQAIYAPEEEAGSTKIAPAAGGRPPAAFWDDLWNAIWGEIYRGDLIPQRQADIERAMADWVAAQGRDVSESTLKPRARKMFAALQAEGKNS